MRTFWQACFLVGLAAGVLSPAMAQVVLPSCSANAAVPPTARPDGLAELAGDIVIVCQGTSTSALTATVQLNFNTNVTSRLTAGTTSEALLLVDEPTPGAQVAGVNLFQGAVTSGNQLTFSNVPLFPAAAETTTRILRLTNLRFDASALPVGSQVVVSVVLSGAPVVLNDPVQAVAFVGVASTFSATGSGQCANASGSLQFGEGFEAQFKVQGAGTDTPGAIDSGQESGFVPDPAIAGVGLADAGTQFAATFTGLPDGALVSVPASASNGALQVTAVSPAGGGSLPVVSGTATVVYEVTAADPVLLDSIAIPFTASGVAGNFSVAGSLAPSSAVDVASDSAPIPRFVGQATTSTLIAAPCAPPPTAAPATSRYGLALLVLLLALVAAWWRRAVR